MATVSPAFPRRRVVRRARPVLDQAWDTALCDFPAEIRPAIIRYIETMRAASEARGDLTMALSRYRDIRWRDVDAVACKLTAVVRRS